MATRSVVLSLAVLGTGLGVPLLAPPVLAAPQQLYSLQTRCAIKGEAPVPCTVEALEEGSATLYRHRIGSRTETVRITDSPVRMAFWDAASREWKSLKRAEARFSTNTICFGVGDLCVVNPNYLNSVRESNAAATAGRDLVRVHFGADGRIDASCYDAGCEVSKP